MNKDLKMRVDAFIQRLAREDVNMHGFILSANGRRKAEAYYAPFRKGEAHRLYSVSKTFTGIAIGMLIDGGLLRMEDCICDYFRDWLPENPDGRLLRLTIRDMLCMSTCYRYTQYREGTDENWAKSFFTGRPTHEPGTVFYYDTGCSQALAALVRRLSGKETIDFLEGRLFLPLGAADEKYWLRDPSGCCQGGTGLCMSLEDMHRVAECIMDGGRDIIPGWYAREMGEKHIETLLQTNGEEKYGYGWADSSRWSVRKSARSFRPSRTPGLIPWACSASTTRFLRRSIPSWTGKTWIAVRWSSGRVLCRTKPNARLRRIRMFSLRTILCG